MLGLLSVSQCREAVWLPGAISEASVLPQVCNICGPGAEYVTLHERFCLCLFRSIFSVRFSFLDRWVSFFLPFWSSCSRKVARNTLRRDKWKPDTHISTKFDFCVFSGQSCEFSHIFANNLVGGIYQCLSLEERMQSRYVMFHDAFTKRFALFWLWNV